MKPPKEGHMTELQFVDELPGAPSALRAKTAERAEVIKANPGKWARWPSKTPPSGIRKSLERIDTGFEVVGRKLDGEVVAFVRYVPPEGTASDSSKRKPAVTTPPPSSSGHPRASCGTCHQFINIEAGEDSAKALTRHERTNPVCKEANRRRR
jgi:hypothetical protein